MKKLFNKKVVVSTLVNLMLSIFILGKTLFERFRFERFRSKKTSKDGCGFLEI